MGYRTALLLRRLGAEVTAIYEDTPVDWLRNATRLGIVCHAGSARDEALLEQAGIRTAQAIVAATDHDMTNLSVAMDARRLNPDIAIVMRLFDTGLAPHVARALSLRKVLSTSSLAAPVFASAALGHHVCGCFSVSGHAYALSEFAVPPDSPWIGRAWRAVAQQEQFAALFEVGATASIAALPADLPVQTGQRVMLLRRAALAASGHPPGPTPCHATFRRGRTRRLLGGIWRGIPPAIKGVMAALVLVMMAATLTFQHFLHMSPVDAFYFVVTTISTTGYGDFNLQGSASWLKLFGCFIMLCGAALMATVFSVVTDLLLRKRFRHLMETPPEADGPHIVLVGHGSIGQRVAEVLLHAGVPVVILTPATRDQPDRTEATPYPMITADPRSDSALTRAGIATATAVVAVTEDDIMNLGVALQARRLNPALHAVIRTFDPALGTKLQSHLGGDTVISVSAVSAPTFAAAALCRDVVQAIVWRDHLVLVQLTEGDSCLAPGLAAPAVSFRVPAGADLFAPRAPATATGSELRISALRLG